MAIFALSPDWLNIVISFEHTDLKNKTEALYKKYNHRVNYLFDNWQRKPNNIDTYNGKCKYLW